MGKDRKNRKVVSTTTTKSKLIVRPKKKRKTLRTWNLSLFLDKVHVASLVLTAELYNSLWAPQFKFLFMEIRPHLVLGKQVVATAIGGPPPVHRL